MSGSPDFPDRIVHQNMLDSRISALTDQHHSQSRHEVHTRAMGDAQASHEQNLRQAANMEVGRALNVSTVV